jgi:hypothetical protein
MLLLAIEGGVSIWGRLIGAPAISAISEKTSRGDVKDARLKISAESVLRNN